MKSIIDEINEIHEIEEINEIDENNENNEINEIDEIDEIDEINKINEINEINEIDEISISSAYAHNPSGFCANKAGVVRTPFSSSSSVEYSTSRTHGPKKPV